MTVSTTGSAALAAVLDPIAAEINEELAALKTLFVEELMPRAKRVGDALRKARANFGTNAHFYEWSEKAVGIKERQVRTYLRFADRLPAIEAAAEAEGAKITSMEQGLALLAPAKPQEERTEQELAVAAMAVSTGRAVGAIGRAIEASVRSPQVGCRARNCFCCKTLQTFCAAGAQSPRRMQATSHRPPQLMWSPWQLTANRNGRPKHQSH